MQVEDLWSALEREMTKHPQALALWANDASFTYQQLIEAIAGYRAYLVSQGVNPGDRVAVLLPRESALVVSILAIFSLKAVYVPLNSRNPMMRNQDILLDSQCQFLISEECYEEVKILSPYSSNIPSLISKNVCFSPNLDEELAYIIYTSGSTGKPKGVMISHTNVLSMIHWALSEFSKPVLTFVLASTSICFDLSIFEMFVPLFAGGCVVLVDNALTLVDKCFNFPLKLINTVPSAARALLEHDAIPDSVEVINLAGEALEQALVDALYQKSQVKRVYNLYGPSETTTYSTSYLALAQVNRTMVPIGKPILGTTLYVLDQQQLPVPLLARGELYIGGSGVTLGYCQRPEETASRYIWLELNGKQERVYRTGDLVRLNHDRDYEYLGRIDHQVKLSGYRIELDEIVHTLQQHHSILQAYVMVRPVQNEQALVAYIIFSSGDSISIEELRQWLLQRLPDYMLPHHFLMLDAFPLNANGKVDRHALPEPSVFVSDESNYQNDIEKNIALLWQSLLGERVISRDANFFHQGGHSLLAARLLAKLNAHFGVVCHLDELFRFPLISTQAQLVSQRLQGKQTYKWALIERPEFPPLSYGQERLWYVQQAEKNIPISNIPIMVTFHGKLDIAALESALQRVVNRHEILRTVYVMHDKILTQRVLNTFSIRIRTESLDDITELSEKLMTEANQLFDLSCDLMLRVALFVLPHQKSVLMLTQHHIASDAWSLNILMHELSLFYRTYHRQQPLPELPIPIQYADYSCWQRSEAYAQKIRTDLLYWQEKLKDAPDTIALPYSRQRDPIQTYEGAFYRWELDPELLQALKKVAQAHDCTLFMVFFCAFNVLLYRYSQQEDLCVGILSANRAVDEVSHTLGFFVNSLVMRNQIKPEMPIYALLKQVKETVLEGLTHQDIPFDRLVEALSPVRQINKHPLFQVLFSLQNALDTELVLDDLELEVEEFDRHIAKFDLTVSLAERGEKLAGIMEYSTSLFDRATIERMTRHFKVILAAFTETLTQSVASIPILPTEEIDQAVVQFNQTEHPLPIPATLAVCFEKVVHQYGSKTALITAEECLTYDELNLRANQLAHTLMGYGVQENTPIGVLLPRGIDAIVSFLAILKVGGYYVPLDLHWPSERFSFVVEDAAIHLMITNTQAVNLIPSSPFLFPIVLDESNTIQNQPVTFQSISVKAEDPCYVMYTSGSTGQPKGVMATHVGVIRLVHATNYVTLDAAQCFLQVSPLAFDGATFDIFGSLLHGGTLVLMPDGIPELSKLSQYLHDYQVTTLFVTTQLFNSLVDYKLMELSSLKQVLFGGEVASIEHVKRFKAYYPDCALSNIYGPTECTTYALFYPIPQDFNVSQPLPLGRPITNTFAVILSAHHQICPKEVYGELYLGGLGVAKGYLNQPTLTQEKFIDNPFSELNTDKLYKTGDICFYREDGLIMFVGRADNQVKLRGHRIELAEIEQTLREIPTVFDAIVVLQQPENYLVAYLLGHTNEMDSTKIRRQLARRLPHYMLPDAIECLNAYPLTMNGKVDKDKLPRWQAHATLSDETLIETADSEITQIIQNVWEEVLEHPCVGLHDNFFEVGGNSLKLILILERLQMHFKTDRVIFQKLEIVTLFQYSTIHELAVYLSLTEENQRSAPIASKRVNLRDKRKAARALSEAL